MSFRKITKKTNGFVTSVSPSVHMEQIGSHWTNFHGFCYLNIFIHLSRKFKFHYNLTRITVTLHEGKYTLMIISHSVNIRTNKTGNVRMT